jgi:type I restriction enzyme M protein
MPSGVFKPYAGVSTAILIFTKTESGGTDGVWFYDMHADGFALNDKRTAMPDADDIPDILNRWNNIEAEKARTRLDQSFFVPAQEIRDNNYDLSINKYKEVEYEHKTYDAPEAILSRLSDLDKEIAQTTRELTEMLKAGGYDE